MGKKSAKGDHHPTISLEAPRAITGLAAESFRVEVEKCTMDKRHWRTLDLHFHLVKEIDLMGLSLLAEVIKSASDVGKSVRLIGPHPTIRGILGSTRIDQYAEIIELGG